MLTYITWLITIIYVILTIYSHFNLKAIYAMVLLCHFRIYLALNAKLNILDESKNDNPPMLIIFMLMNSVGILLSMTVINKIFSKRVILQSIINSIVLCLSIVSNVFSWDELLDNLTMLSICAAFMLFAQFLYIFT